jgi:hypothetical protein
MVGIPSSVRSLCVALTLSLALVGCVVEPGPVGFSGGFVSTAPPAPQFESFGAPPSPGWFWVGGNWNWTGGRYTWNRGHWQAPRSGYRWVPQRWDRGSQGWRSSPGHWERSRRR